MPTVRNLSTLLYRIGMILFCIIYFSADSIAQFYTFDFVADQASWSSSGDCGVVSSAYNSYSPTDNVVDIQSSFMAFIDGEGTGCTTSCPASLLGGGDLENYYTTNPIDISNRCQVFINVDFSFFDDTNIPGIDTYECNSAGCGEDWLSFEYSVDGGSFQYFNSGVTNQFCATTYSTGDSDSVTSTTFQGSTVEIRIQVGSQGVKEGIRIDLMDLEEIPTTISVQAGAASTSVCEGQNILLEETGSGGSTYLWTGPNGFVGPMQNATVTGSDLPGIGNHDYTVVVTDANNCTASDVVALSVVSGFTATLLGGGDLCPDQCTEIGEHMEVGLSGGAEPYTVTFSVNGFTIPFPFAFDIGDNFFQICHESSGIIPSWDTGTNPVSITIPDAIWQLAGGSISIDIDNIVDDNGCAGTINGGSFDLSLASAPTAVEPNPDPICFDETTGYNLTQWDLDILTGGGGDVIWLDDDTDMTSTISNPTSYDLANNNPVWAVVFDDPCYSNIVELDFDINLKPIISPSGISDLVFCGEEIELPNFDLLFDIQNENDPQYFLDANLTDGPYREGQVLQLPLGLNTLYVYDSSAPGCDDQSAANIVLFQEPQIVFPTGSLSACGTIELPEPVVDNENSMTFEYNTEPDGSGDSYLDGAEFDITSGINLLYLIVTNNGGFIPCIDTAHIQLVYLAGTSYTATIPAQVCDTLFLPQIIPSSPSVGYFTSPNGGIRYNPGDTLTQFSLSPIPNSPDTLFLFDPTQSGACATKDTLIFEIGQTPILDVPFQTQFCDQGLLPPPSNNNPNLEYASDRGFNNILNPIIPITQSTQIYFRDSIPYSTGGACYAMDSFFLEIVAEPYAGQDSSIVICELTNQELDFYSILGNPDLDGDFSSDTNLNFFNPREVDVVNMKVGNYTVTYEIIKPGCLPQSSQISIEVIPPIDVGFMMIDSICSSAGVLDLPFSFGNPVPGGEWYIEDPNGNEIIVPDPTAWDISNLANGVYRLIYSVIGTDNNPYCANRSSNSIVTIVSDPYTGTDTTFKICQGYSASANLMELLGNPDSGGVFTIDGNPIDFEITDSTTVDLSVLGVGTQEIYYGIEQEGCTPNVSTITIEVIPIPSLGTTRSDTLCNVPTFLIPTDYIQGNDPLSDLVVLDPSGNPVPAAPGLGWAIGQPGVYEVVYTALTDPDYNCDPVEGRFEITFLESVNAGDNSNITICKGQAIDMNTLLSNDASLGGTFYQDVFPVLDPTQWLPVSQNNTVQVQYILETNSITCEADTAFITVNLSDELSAGTEASDNIVCRETIINLQDYLEDETPGGEFFRTNNLTVAIDPNVFVISSTEYTYIIPGAPGCDPDTTDFMLDIVPSAQISVALSDFELCYEDNGCISMQVSSQVTGDATITVRGGTALNDIITFSHPLDEGSNTLHLCPDQALSDAMGVDTVFIGPGPLAQIDITQLSNTVYPCQSESLAITETIKINLAYELSIDTTICLGSAIQVGGIDFYRDTTIMETGMNGCDSILNIKINNPLFVPRDIEQDLCQGQTYGDIPGYTFTENIDTTIVLIGASAFNCDSTINLKLNFTNKAVGPMEFRLCHGDSVEVDGVIFKEGFTTDEVPAPIGSTFGCDSATLVTVEFYDEIILVDEARTICSNETFPLGDQVFDIGNTTGIALLAGEGAGGCDSMVNVILDFYPSEFPYQAMICANDSITIGTDIYSASNTSGNSLTGENTINGCDSIVAVTVVLMDLEERVLDPMLCEDRDFTINERVYNFANPFGIEYLENATGCDTMLTIDITSLQSSTTNLEIELCTDVDTIINGITYNATNTMDESILENAAGCDSTVTVSVAISAPSMDYLTDICSGDTEGTLIITDVSGLNLPAEYQIEGITGTITINEFPYSIGGISAGTSTLFLDDGTCSLTQVVELDGGAQPTVDISATDLGENNFQLDINAGLQITTYQWMPSALLDCTDCASPVASIAQEEIITVTITSDMGCTYDKTITLTPSDETNQIDSTRKIFIPNSLSFNDPINNTFYLLSDEDFTVEELSIYDRWGNKVFVNENFMTNDASQGWDGRRNDKVEQGVYVYVVRYTDPERGEQILHGDITVIR